MDICLHNSTIFVILRLQQTSNNPVALNMFINRYLGLILLVSAMVGLFFDVPFLDASRVIIVSLAGIIFISYFRVHLTTGLFFEDMKPIGFYFLIRFILIPVLFYLSLIKFSSFYAVAFLLLLLLPTAVSSPAFTALFGGNVKLSLKILIITSFASILTIPAITHLMITQKVGVNSSEMLMTMVYTIVYPFIFHLPLRASHMFRKFINNNGPLLTAIGLAIILMVSASYNRAIIFENPEKVALYAAIAVVFYLICYLTGFYLMSREAMGNRISYSIGSGANNIGLGVALTALYFPGDTNVFFIVSQLAWVIMLIPIRHFYSMLPLKVTQR
jgi:bile acid:Na+ symporter, BASS family